MSLRRLRVLAAKVESTVGTAESLSASEAAFNVFDAIMQPIPDTGEREGQGSFSQRTATQGARAGRLSFRTQLTGGSTIPDQLAVLLPACGYVETATVFSPVSQAPGGAGGTKTLTMGLYVDGVKKLLHGCMGNARLEFMSGKPVNVFWEFTGIWNAPTDVAPLAPTYPTALPPRFASSGLLYGGAYAPKISRLVLDFGNQVILREDSTTPSGFYAATITGRKPTVVMDPESVLVATKDWYGTWLASTEAALAWSIGTTGNKVAFAAPKAQIMSPEEGNRNDVQIDTLNMQLNRSAAAGDDELTITVT